MSDIAPRPWQAGLATGVGSMPGVDPVGAASVVAGELPDLPHLAELPGRGAGADMIGRATAICVDMPAEVMPSGWRLARRPGSDSRRAQDFLAWDLDAAEQHFAGADWVKVQVAGPWTLAASVETPNGRRAVRDEGAVRDLAASLAEGLSGHVAALEARLPGTRIVVQVDEPSLPAVLEGTLPTASGFGTVAPVAASRVAEVLSGLAASLVEHAPVLHCCHPRAPWALVAGCGFQAVSADLTHGLGGAAAMDQWAEIVESGITVLAGLVPASAPVDPAKAKPSTVAEPLMRAWSELGLDWARLEQVVVTPACGLGAADTEWARTALRLARDTGRLIADRARD